MFKKIRKIIGSLFIILAGLSFVGLGIWGFILSLQILNYVGGFALIVIGFIFIPITYTVAPWYAVVEFNNFFPLIISYGGLILGYIFGLLGTLIIGEK
jgi:hypothetical protein